MCTTVLEATQQRLLIEHPEGPVKPPDLKEVDVPVRVAEAENILLLGMLGNGLHHAVLGQQGVARRQLLLRGAFAVGLVEQQSTSWGHMWKPVKMCRKKDVEVKADILQLQKKKCRRF